MAYLFMIGVNNRIKKGRCISISKNKMVPSLSSARLLVHSPAIGLNQLAPKRLFFPYSVISISNSTSLPGHLSMQANLVPIPTGPFVSFFRRTMGSAQSGYLSTSVHALNTSSTDLFMVIESSSFIFFFWISQMGEYFRWFSNSSFQPLKNMAQNRKARI